MWLRIFLISVSFGFAPLGVLAQNNGEGCYLGECPDNTDANTPSRTPPLNSLSKVIDKWDCSIGNDVNGKGYFRTAEQIGDFINITTTHHWDRFINDSSGREIFDDLDARTETRLDVRKIVNIKLLEDDRSYIILECEDECALLKRTGIHRYYKERGDREGEISLDGHKSQKKLSFNMCSDFDAAKGISLIVEDPNLNKLFIK